MSAILFQIIRDNVYQDKAIQDISFASTGKREKWIFDFKRQSFSRVFLEEYARCFWRMCGNQYARSLQIGGMETGAISLIASIMLCAPAIGDISGFYVRKSRKKSGLANLIEGELRPNTPIVLVDDILNSGMTLRKQIAILEDLGYKVSAVFVCLRYSDLSSYQDLVDKGISIVSIFELNDFKEVLPVNNLIADPVRASHEKYVFDYRVKLTGKPNLYLVEPKSGPLLIGAHVYAGADDGSFSCLLADDGSVVWTYKIFFGFRGKHVLSSPAVYEDKIIFGAYDGNVYCLNRFSGKRVWVCTDADWVGSSPCLDRERGVVYIGLEFGLPTKQGGLAALDMRNGEVRWEYRMMAGKTHASPAYSRRNNMVVCGCDDGYLYAFHAGTGKILWKFKTDGPIRQGVVFDTARDLAVFGSMDGKVYAIHIRSGELYAVFEARFGFCSTPALRDDFVIIGSLDKQVYCFNLSTKKTEWIFETSGRVFASPLLDYESVFIGSNDGRLYELDACTGKLRAFLQLTERIVNGIQVDHLINRKRILYIPTHACELYRMREA